MPKGESCNTSALFRRSGGAAPACRKLLGSHPDCNGAGATSVVAMTVGSTNGYARTPRKSIVFFLDKMAQLLARPLVQRREAFTGVVLVGLGVRVALESR